MNKQILKTVNYIKLLEWSTSRFEMGSGLIQQRQNYTVFRNYFKGHFIYTYINAHKHV